MNAMIEGCTGSGDDTVLKNKAIGTTEGLIVNLQDYSVHDGYGIRTIVFMKGCPLRCSWCQNPEAMATNREIMFRSTVCMACGKCGEVCPEAAILQGPDKRVDFMKCTFCMKCTEVCPTRALTAVGKTVTVDELMAVILSYKPFYDGSDRGGITLSGGEPTAQPEFARALMQRCKEEGIHTAMETCGHVSLQVLRDLAAYADLLLYDIKHMDGPTHQKHTGVSNRLILSNLERLAHDGSPEIVVRIPLIPDFNDSDENVEKTCRFVSSLGIPKVDLLAFNELPSGKYNTLGKKWKYKLTKRQTDTRLGDLKKIAESHGLAVTIGGLW